MKLFLQLITLFVLFFVVSCQRRRCPANFCDNIQVNCLQMKEETAQILGPRHVQLIGSNRRKESTVNVMCKQVGINWSNFQKLGELIKNRTADFKIILEVVYKNMICVPFFKTLHTSVFTIAEKSSFETRTVQTWKIEKFIHNCRNEDLCIPDTIIFSLCFYIVRKKMSIYHMR
nr:unnamed protein product [Callosobruchus chinensis]